MSGIVGAGGNVGAVLAGFLFTSNDVSYRDSLFTIGIVVMIVSVLSLILGAVKMRGPVHEAESAPEPQEAYALVNK